MKRPKTNPAGLQRARLQRGFTLVELLVSLLVLVTVSGAVFEQINKMQKKASAEAMKLDMSQQAREFVDQTVRDLHASGYPGASMYSDPTLRPDLVATGLVSVSPTQILLEGDVNNDGKVYSVSINYVDSDPNDPNCPCIRRSAIRKDASFDSLHQPSSAEYTETEHVFPPGTGAAQSGEELFAYFDQNGSPVDIGSGVDISNQSGRDTIALIKTVKINLSLQTNRDPETGNSMRTSISASSRLNQ